MVDTQSSGFDTQYIRQDLEVKVEGPEIQGHSGLHSEFKASLDYMNLPQNNRQTNNKK